jgi:hypothetical protein
MSVLCQKQTLFDPKAELILGGFEGVFPDLYDRRETSESTRQFPLFIRDILSLIEPCNCGCDVAGVS